MCEYFWSQFYRKVDPPGRRSLQMMPSALLRFVREMQFVTSSIKGFKSSKFASSITNQSGNQFKRAESARISKNVSIVASFESK
jgi:hypothetical protein